MASAPALMSLWSLLGSAAPDAGAPVPGALELRTLRYSYLPQAVREAEFYNGLSEELNVSAVLVHWQRIPSGGVFALPDAVYRPRDPEVWRYFESREWDDFIEEPLPSWPPPPIEGLPTPVPETDALVRPAAVDLELVAYHWKSRAVIEKTAWRVAEEVESVVGQPLPRLFRPVLEEVAPGERVLGLRAPRVREEAPEPDTGAAAVGDAGAADPPATDPAADDAAVTLRDAVAILRMIGGRAGGGEAQAPSAFQSIAADFDGNGAVGLADALGVLRHAVGRGGPKPAWAFVDEADPGLPGRAGMHPGHLPDLSARLDDAKGKVGLVGVLRGDVDGSWTPPQALERLPDTWFGDLAGRVGARLSEGDIDPTRWGVYAG